MSGQAFQWSLKAVCDAAQGILSGDDAPIHGINIDSRKIEVGQLFVAISGDRFDGHDFIEQACQQGAAGVVISRAVACQCPSIRVQDTRVALGLIAQAWRRQFTLPLIAVTGSNGKTTVKEMLSAILSVYQTTLATQGNLNNDIGVPLMLLRLRTQHQCAVIEMGANHAGEIAWLSRIAEPTVALVNNAGSAHLEGFGSLDGVAHAKGEIYGGLSQNGTAVINADDKYAGLWRGLSKGRHILTFGLDNSADVTAAWQATSNGSEMTLHTPQGDITVQLALPGRHNVMNALAASTTALAAGASLKQIRDGLQSVHSVSGRLQIKSGICGSRVIDDTYNANPDSLRAGLNVMNDFDGRHFLALGDMGELGHESEVLHREAGRLARQSGVDRLYTVGSLANLAANSFGEDAFSYNDQTSMISALQGELDKDVTLLVKGSRLAHMENVVQALTIKAEVS